MTNGWASWPRSPLAKSDCRAAAMDAEANVVNAVDAPEIDYPCVGVCMVDADSGYCLGCGRPPAQSPAAGGAAARPGDRTALDPATASADGDA